MSFLGNRSDSFGYSSTSYDHFNGDGVTTVFTLSRTVSANSDIEVIVNNVVQDPGVAYYIVNNPGVSTQLAFTGTPSVGTGNIAVIYRQFINAALGVSANSITAQSIAANTIQAYHLSSGLLNPIVNTFTGDNVTTSFTLSQAALSANSCLVTVNGITQNYPSNYSVNGTTLTFTSAPATSSVIRCTQQSIIGTGVVPIDGSITTSKYAANSIPTSAFVANTIPTTAFKANSITTNLIASVSNTTIVGLINSNQINTVSNTQITGNIISSQITSVANTQLTGTLTRTQLDNASSSGTGALSIPFGTTAQRPAANTVGYTRFNTDTGYSEYWTGTVWTPYGNSSTPTINYLVVAGGGGGATDSDVGGGGGAGGLLTGVTPITATQTYTVTVGGGGSQGSGPDSTGTGGGTNGSQGQSSSIGSLVTTVGGGYGGTRSQAGGSGGSGGGGGDAGAAGGSGTSGQGFPGGNAPPINSNGGWDQGAGGGAGGAAVNGTSSIPSTAGPGLASSISGSSVTYAAGGRGTQFLVGAANSGNGGSGCRNGGSGIVIISYPQTYKQAIATGTYSMSPVGTNYVYTFTGSGSITF